MKKIQMLCPQSKWAKKCTYDMKPTRIVVHNTANDASARNEVAYMIRNNDWTSFHFAVDDVEAVQGLPLDRNAWCSGDGAEGKGNREGIHIEICYSKSGGSRFIQAEKNAASLIAELLKNYGWGLDRVTKHADYMKKYCPHRTLDMGWDRFLKMVSDELEGQRKSQPRIIESADDDLEIQIRVRSKTHSFLFDRSGNLVKGGKGDDSD